MYLGTLLVESPQSNFLFGLCENSTWLSVHMFLENILSLRSKGDNTFIVLNKCLALCNLVSFP